MIKVEEWTGDEYYLIGVFDNPDKFILAYQDYVKERMGDNCKLIGHQIKVDENIIIISFEHFIYDFTYSEIKLNQILW